MKSGGYLSSQRLTVSTLGVKELNFCVRNGNRWILFAIVTAMVIYTAFPQNTYIFSFNLFEKINNYIANFTKDFFLLVLLEFEARKNYRFHYIEEIFV